jgi:hypothetical protein
VKSDAAKQGNKATPETPHAGTGARPDPPVTVKVPDLDKPTEMGASAFKIKFEDDGGQRYLLVTYLNGGAIWEPEITVRLVRDDGSTHEAKDKRTGNWATEPVWKVKVPTNPYREVGLKGKGRGGPSPVVISATWDVNWGKN